MSESSEWEHVVNVFLADVGCDGQDLLTALVEFRKMKKQISELQDQIDLQCDEFKRIKAVSTNSEVMGLCYRATNRTHQHVSVIAQRDSAKKEAEDYREALEWTKKILPSTNEQIDHLLKERPFELYHILCVDVPDVIEHALKAFREGK